MPGSDLGRRSLRGGSVLLVPFDFPGRDRGRATGVHDNWEPEGGVGGAALFVLNCGSGITSAYRRLVGSVLTREPPWMWPAMTVTRPALVRVSICPEGGQSGARAAGNPAEPARLPAAPARSGPCLPWNPRTFYRTRTQCADAAVEVRARPSSSGAKSRRCPSPGQSRRPGRSRGL